MDVTKEKISGGFPAKGEEQEGISEMERKIWFVERLRGRFNEPSVMCYSVLVVRKMLKNCVSFPGLRQRSYHLWVSSKQWCFSVGLAGEGNFLRKQEVARVEMSQRNSSVWRTILVKDGGYQRC